MYPLKFKPILKTVVWGGEKIPAFKGLETEQPNIGESWELSGVKGDESIVTNGPLAGKTITELIEKYKGELIGEKNFAKTGAEFPLLIKFIDARDDLSIQVHPDDELAAKRHDGSKGKTEMWYVVQADEDAHLMSGFIKKITPEDYVEAIKNDTITDVLHDYKVKAGDVFFLPAGRIHSIGTGCFIAEIQQTSNITYRIYDFNRPGLDGKPRELHTELSMAAIDYSVLPDYRTKYSEKLNKANLLVECKYFTTHLYNLTQPITEDIKDLDSFIVFICISGKGSLTDSTGNTVTIQQGETILLPASSTAFTLTPAGGQLKVLTSFIK